MENPVYSFVIPVYNEQESLPELHRRLSGLLDRLDGSAEVILVDDGSTDSGYRIMREINERDPRFKAVQLSRNFGHQTAITVGMDLSSGQATIIMDADLQDPPETVLEMTRLWREGHEVVYGIREDRPGETWFKRATSALFYRFLRKLTDLDIPVDTGDFRLVERKALDVFLSMREHNRYVRGMFSWVGFRQVGVKYRRAERLAGKTKYPFRKMLKLAVDGALSFSMVPLRLTLYLGLLVAGLSFLAGFVAIIMKLSGLGDPIQGWASLVVLLSFLGGIQLVVIGIVGEYVGRVYEEVRHRPLYVLRQSQGFSHDR